MAYLANILVYPIKSLDGCHVTAAALLAGGALEHDRRFALVDTAGKFVNGKREPRIHQIRASFDLEQFAVTLSAPGMTMRQFSLIEEPRLLESWFSDYFGFPVSWQENTQTGCPDHLEAAGPTVISTATLQTVASWFSGLTVDDCRRRFRANLEIDDVEPFWEDRLVGPAGKPVHFHIGEVDFEGVNPCQRCVVPSRDPATGEVLPRFQIEFAKRRQATLPTWATQSRFDHFYRLSVNTIVAGDSTGRAIRVGDEVELTPGR